MSHKIAIETDSLNPMATLRAAGVFSLIMVSFIVGAPLQWVILHFAPKKSAALPVLFNHLLLSLLQIKVVVRGESPKRGPDAPPQLLVSNHVSWSDVPALGTLNTISFLSKREVSRWPIIGTFARLQRTIFVERESRKSIRDANAAMARRMLVRGWVALFPEGTTTDGSMVGRFHSSHFAAARDLLEIAPEVEAVHVHAVAIRYSAAHAPWLGDDLLLPHVWALAKGGPVTCELLFSPPILFDRTTDRKAIALECTKRIEAMLAGEKMREGAVRTA
jgi:1-acyl-sn-glycerol-3-phosphate acyltransferase